MFSGTDLVELLLQTELTDGATLSDEVVADTDSPSPTKPIWIGSQRPNITGYYLVGMAKWVVPLDPDKQ